MHSLEIERRLRLPAPDEPRFLPALILPSAAGSIGVVRGRTGIRQGASRSGFVSSRLVLAVLALVAAMVAAIASGAIRLENPFDGTRTFAARGLSIQYPDSWQIVAALDANHDEGSWTTLIVSNKSVEGCSAADVGTEAPQGPVPSGGEVDATDQTGLIFAVEDRIFACAVEAPMAEGEIRLMLLRGYPQRIAIGPIEPYDPTDWFGPDAQPGGGPGYIPTAADGWTDRIDG
jgi:hypothetical protein